MHQLPQALISDFLTLDERQAEQARSEATTWPESVVNPVLFGGRRLLPARTYADLLDNYDRRGSGESTGTFETADFSLLAADARAAITVLATRCDIDAQRIGLYGVSQGGWIAPLVAVQCPTAALLVIVSGCGVTPAKQMIYSARTALRRANYADEIIERATALRHRVDAYFRGALPRAVVQADLDDVRTEPWFALTFLSGELPEAVQSKKRLR